MVRISNAQSRFIELEVNDIVICVHFVPQPGDLHELPVQFQDVLHFAQATRINLNFEHAPNTSGPIKAMQFISREEMITGPCASELAIASGAKLRK